MLFIASAQRSITKFRTYVLRVSKPICNVCHMLRSAAETSSKHSSFVELLLTYQFWFDCVRCWPDRKPAQFRLHAKFSRTFKNQDDTSCGRQSRRGTQISSGICENCLICRDGAGAYQKTVREAPVNASQTEKFRVLLTGFTPHDQCTFVSLSLGLWKGNVQKIITSRTDLFVLRSLLLSTSTTV